MRQLTRITAPSIMDPMKPSSLLATLCIFGITGCHHPLTPDKPQLTPQVRLIDTTFYSAILARDMHLRLIVPAAYASNQKLPVVYLLHGAGADYRDWSKFLHRGNVNISTQGAIILTRARMNSR